MILADTGIWIDYFRGGNPPMMSLLTEGQIVMHPYVVAELALGSLRDRKRTLATLDAMATVQVAQQSEVRAMIESHKLYARGIGLTDVHLLASCLLTSGVQLWTRDAALRRVAQALGASALIR